MKASETDSYEKRTGFRVYVLIATFSLGEKVYRVFAPS